MRSRIHRRMKRFNGVQPERLELAQRVDRGFDTFGDMPQWSSTVGRVLEFPQHPEISKTSHNGAQPVF
jgi:hypothetical protein